MSDAPGTPTPGPVQGPAPTPTHGPPTPQPRSLVCPYCGAVSRTIDKCGSCGGRFDPLSRQATQNAMGPWWVRGRGSPTGPGCSYRMMVSLVERGTIKRDTVVRGPTTRQFWMLAAKTPGIAHRCGLCHSCGETVDPASHACPGCGAAFPDHADRQRLGLGPVRELPGHASVHDQEASPGAARAAPVPAPADVPSSERRGPDLAVVGGVGAVCVLGGLMVGATIAWLALGLSAPDGAPDAPVPTVVTEPPAGPVDVEPSDAVEASSDRADANAVSPGLVAADEPPPEDAAEPVVAAGGADVEAIEALIAQGDWGSLMEARDALAQAAGIPESERDRLAGVIDARLRALRARMLP